MKPEEYLREYPDASLAVLEVNPLFRLEVNMAPTVKISKAKTRKIA